MMMPCLYHDIFAGCAREDMSLVINKMYKRNIISKEEMNRKFLLFKNSLHGSNKRSWLPSLKGDSFKTKLPGNMSPQLTPPSRIKIKPIIYGNSCVEALPADKKNI